MKKLTTLILTIILSTAAMAGGSRMTLSDIYYSTEYGSWVVEMGIENPDETINSFQCDIAIPKTFTFDVGTFRFSERALELKMGKYIDTHTCASAVRSNGCLRVLVYSAENKTIQGTSGTVLTLALKDASPYFGTPHSSRFKANMTNVVLSRSEEGDVMEDAEYPEAIVNDSTLQCYNCMDDNAFVIGSITDGELEEININLATDDRLVTVDMTRCSNANVGTLEVLNGNTIIMAASETQVDNEHNVFWKEKGEWTCNSFMLYDEGLSLRLPFKAHARHFSYDRSYTGGVWNTACLPAELTDEQYAALKERGVTVRRMASFDDAHATISFSYATSFNANVPYVLKPESSGMVFCDIADVTLLPSERQNITANGLTMAGNYDYTTICSTPEVSRYGYEEGTGEFCKLGNNCILKPFRCFLELPAEASSAKPRIYISASDTNGIDNIAADSHNNGNSHHHIYSVDGRKVASGANPDAPGNMPAGVYINNGKKVIIY